MTELMLRQFVEEVARELGPAWYVDPFDRRDEVDVIHREAAFGQFRVAVAVGGRRLLIAGVLPATEMRGVEMRTLSTSTAREPSSVADWIREVLPDYMRSLAAVRDFNSRERADVPAVAAADRDPEGSGYPRPGNGGRPLSPGQQPGDGGGGPVPMPPTGRAAGKTNALGKWLQGFLAALSRQPVRSFVILVTEPISGSRFAYGPYPGHEAAAGVAAQLRDDFQVASMDELTVEVLTLTPLTWGRRQGGV